MSRAAIFKDKTAITEKIREAAASVLPIVLIVVLLCFGVLPVGTDVIYHIPCLKNINTVDTTGAGDSFCGAALSKLLDYSLDFNSLNEDSYVDILRFANAAANISTTCYGAVPSMPESETIESVLMNNSIKVTKIV